MRVSNDQARAWAPIIHSEAGKFGGGEDTIQDAWVGVLGAKDPDGRFPVEEHIRTYARYGILRARKPDVPIPVDCSTF